MKIPKTPKGLFKLLLSLSTEGIEVLAHPGLSKEEYEVIGAILADIQNELGSHSEILKKYSLEYKG